MKAIVQNGYGSPDDLALKEVAKPAITDDQVLMRVHAVPASTKPALPPSPAQTGRRNHAIRTICDTGSHYHRT